MMNNGKQILLIEHELDRIEYAGIIERAGGKVTTIDEYNEEIIRSVLEKNFDFIITDAFFLPKNTSHTKQGELKDEYKLPEIVKLIREVDKRVIIIVFTGYNDKLNIADLVDVDFMFDKEYLRADLFKWQFERMMQDKLFSNHYEHAIIQELSNFLKTDDNLIWKSEIEDMLKKYRNGINESDQFEEIVTSCNQIFLKLDDSDKFNLLLKKVRDFEPLNLIGSPRNFGHLRHVINVFWLGYYILNEILIKDESLLKNIWVNEDISSLNKSWLIASLFHDIGHFGENHDKLLKKIENLIEFYPQVTIKENNDRSEVKFSFEDVKMNEFKSIITNQNEKLQSLFDVHYTKDKIDHGILSSMTIYKHLFDTSLENSDIKSLQAISFHNIFENKVDLLKDYSFSEFPILNLLILCDHLESWDRETGFENKYEDRKKIERIELIKLKSENNTISFTINYQMYRAYISTNEDETKYILTELIIKNIKPLFEKMIFNSIFKLQIEFLLNFKHLYMWPNK